MKIRRNFSFWPGEKTLLNRAYRTLVDRWLARKYQLTDYFFDLTQCIEENKLGQVTSLAKSSSVELMTHPIVPREADYLMSDEFSELLQRLENRSKLCLRTRQFYFRVHQILALKLIQRKLIEMN